MASARRGNWSDAAGSGPCSFAPTAIPPPTGPSNEIRDLGQKRIPDTEGLRVRIVSANPAKILENLRGECSVRDIAGRSWVPLEIFAAAIGADGSGHSRTGPPEFGLKIFLGRPSVSRGARGVPTRTSQRGILGPSPECGYRASPSASRPASVIRTRATSISLPPALTFSCAMVASPRLTSPAIVETLKPCAASNGPVTPLRPEPASKLTARRCSALRRIVGTGRMLRVRRRLRWRDGAGGFLPGLCTVGSRSS